MATCDQISLQCEAVGQLIPRRPLGVLLIRGSITQPEEDRRVLLERGARPIDLSTFKDQRTCKLRGCWPSGGGSHCREGEQ